MFCNDLNTSFRTSSALLSFWNPSTVSVVCTPRASKDFCAFFPPSAAWVIIWGSFTNPISSSVKDTPAPSAARRKPFNVSTETPVFVDASTSWLDISAMCFPKARTAKAAAPAATPIPLKELLIPFPTPLAVLPTFFNARSCFLALFSLDLEALVYALSKSFTSRFDSFSERFPTFFSPLTRF